MWSDQTAVTSTCRFESRPNSYDHKRHHEMKEAGRPVTDTKLQVWDVVLLRKDGGGVWLHPQWNGTKVESFKVEGHDEEVRIPNAGLGRSDGRGTYNLYKEIGNQRTLRFGPL